ncbi:MAG: peptidoglycan-binding protein [Pyrinomonadaceae bacterium]|nr:peptidoglycan-binding protein [Pyrinomonadaceae bacterium]
MAKVKVGQGESAISIAKKNGFFWKTVWNHGENASLKARRKDPSLLFEDDEIFIPEKRKKEVSKATEAEHTFKIKGDPCKLKLRLLQLGKPRKNEDYVIEIGGNRIEGTTDSDGKLEHFIPGDARTGTLSLRNGMETYPVRIGDLDPLEKDSGIQQRLNNLGFSCGSEDGEISEQTKEALKKFQAEYKLKVTGEADSATKAKLKELSK